MHLGADVLESAEAGATLTVEELVRRLQESQRIRVEEAARRVYKMWEEGEIILEDPDPPCSFLRYASSLYSVWFWLLVAVVALTTLSIYVLPKGPPFIYMRYAVGSLSVLYLPGAVLIEVLFPKKDEIEPLERLALSMGLSMACVPLVGLILNYTPWGIRLNPIFACLSSLTIAFSLLAVRRKFKVFKLRGASGFTDMHR